MSQLYGTNRRKGSAVPIMRIETVPQGRETTLTILREGDVMIPRHLWTPILIILCAILAMGLMSQLFAQHLSTRVFLLF